MVKISQLPKKAGPALTDKVPIATATETDYALLSDLVTLFFNNIPSGTIPGITASYVISGGVWTGDSYAGNRNASMTAISVYLNNRTIAIGAVVARTFTASKDTYIDVLDNLDGTGTLVYTEVTNNAVSPALASNSMRIGIIVTGATTIAAVGSVNQGEETKVLPIASSIAYSVTDSLGNLICNRDPNTKLLGYRQIIADQGSITTATDATGLSATIIAPASRKILISAFLPMTNGTVDAYSIGYIMEGATQIQIAAANSRSGATSEHLNPYQITTPSAGSHTYKIQVQGSGGTSTLRGSATSPAFLMVELY